MNLSKISGSEILFRLEKLVRSERKLTHIILSHIYEVDSRRLYFEAGYSSTVEYLKKGLGYSDEAAYTRFRSAQLLGKVPALEEKLENGAVNLSQLTEIQKAVRHQAKSGREISATETEQLIEKLENKNLFETRLVLAQEFNLPIQTHQKIKPQKDESVRVEITFTAEEFAIIQKAKDLLSHQVPSGDLNKLFVALAEKQIRRIEGKKFEEYKIHNANFEEAADLTKVSAAEDLNCDGVTARTENITQQFTVERKLRKNISIKIQREVLKKARYRCEFVNHKTKSKCDSKFQLQIDHIQPLWAGGSDEQNNLRCLCGIHNRMIYRQQSGINS
jgi:hypothetical protein